MRAFRVAVGENNRGNPKHGNHNATKQISCVVSQDNHLENTGSFQDCKNADKNENYSEDIENQFHFELLCDPKNLGKYSPIIFREQARGVLQMNPRNIY